MVLTSVVGPAAVIMATADLYFILVILSSYDLISFQTPDCIEWYGATSAALQTQLNVRDQPWSATHAQVSNSDCMNHPIRPMKPASVRCDCSSSLGFWIPL